MVFDLIKRVTGKDVKMSKVSRVRFKRIVCPNERLEIFVAPLKKEANAYTFRIRIQNEPVSSGVVRLEKNE